MRLGNAAIPRSCFIPLQIVCKKLARLLLPIVRKKGLMPLHSDALVVIFAYNLVYANKYCNILKTAR